MKYLYFSFLLLLFVSCSKKSDSSINSAPDTLKVIVSGMSPSTTVDISAKQNMPDASQKTILTVEASPQNKVYNLLVRPGDFINFNYEFIEITNGQSYLGKAFFTLEFKKQQIYSSNVGAATYGVKLP